MSETSGITSTSSSKNQAELEEDQLEEKSLSLCRSAAEKIFQTTAFSQAAQGLQTRFHSQAFINDKSHSFRIAS
jgi:hypothetical protein